MNLKDLKKVIPHKWRVQSFSKFKSQAACVAYIDARAVMDILDEVVGPDNWQDDYKSVDNHMLAGIGIKCGAGWVWKWDTGSESNIEKEKGMISDSFKRAGVKWGIGRFLYDLDMVYLPANEKKTQNNHPHVVDNNGKRVWDVTKHVNKIKSSTNQQAQRNNNGKLQTKTSADFEILLEKATTVAELGEISDKIRASVKALPKAEAEKVRGYYRDFKAILEEKATDSKLTFNV
ncbi:MAG: Rad52/Rad22 family DNA repair protein [Pseudomonadota bacterium]